MTSVIPIQCLACTRLKKRSAKCDAFPDGIPVGILSGDDHREPIDGDHGKQFLQRNDAQGREAFRLWQRVFDS